ncbi:MAG: hypothetical protein ACUVQH_10500, partial [Thermogutta sp.]
MIKTIRKYVFFASLGAIGAFLLIHEFRGRFARPIQNFPGWSASAGAPGLSPWAAAGQTMQRMSKGQSRPGLALEAVVQTHISSVEEIPNSTFAPNEGTANKSLRNGEQLSERNVSSITLPQEVEGQASLGPASFAWSDPVAVQQPSGIQQIGFWLDSPVLVAPSEEDLPADAAIFDQEAQEVSNAMFLTATAPDRITSLEQTTSKALAPIPDSQLHGCPTQVSLKKPTGLGCSYRYSNFLYCDPCRPSDPWKLP